MPKKRKRSPLPRVTLAKRVAQVLKELVDKVQPKDRKALSEVIVNFGLRIYGEVEGVDTTDAMIVFPDDGCLSVMLALAERSEETGEDFDELCAELVTKIADVPVASPVPVN